MNKKLGFKTIKHEKYTTWNTEWSMCIWIHLFSIIGNYFSIFSLSSLLLSLLAIYARLSYSTPFIQFSHCLIWWQCMNAYAYFTVSVREWRWSIVFFFKYLSCCCCCFFMSLLLFFFFSFAAPRFHLAHFFITCIIPYAF